MNMHKRETAIWWGLGSVGCSYMQLCSLLYTIVWDILGKGLVGSGQCWVLLHAIVQLVVYHCMGHPREGIWWGPCSDGCSYMQLCSSLYTIVWDILGKGSGPGWVVLGAPTCNCAARCILLYRTS